MKLFYIGLYLQENKQDQLTYSIYASSRSCSSIGLL